MTVELGASARAYALTNLTWQRNAERALDVLATRAEQPAP